MKHTIVLLLTLISTSLVFQSAAADTKMDCPVGLVSGLTLDEEFGPGTSEVTRCLSRTHKVKVVYNVNRPCSGDGCAKPYALGNIQNAINDYEITHAMEPGRDYEIVAVAYAGGSDLMLKGNLYEDKVKALMAQGVRFYLCQNTSRNKGIKLHDIIEGVNFVTSGVTALADFQLKGYAVVTPNP